jgi:predicted nucleotidyltransferase
VQISGSGITPNPRIPNKQVLMKTKEEVIAILRSLKPVIADSFKVRSIALFGSYARDEQTETSDVDVVVDVDSSIGLDFVDLADLIEDKLGIAADVIPADGIKPRYREFIAKDLLYV